METAIRLGTASRAVSFAFLVLAAAGCGSSTQPAPCTGSDCAPVTIQSIALSPSSTTVIVGSQASFTATASYSDGSQRDVSAIASWNVSDAAVARVVSAGTVQGLSAGAVVVVATLQGFSVSARLAVTSTAPVSLAVNPASSSVAAGTTMTLAAWATYGDGSTRDVTTEATWASSSNAVATVSGGVVTGVAAGPATISADLSGLRASATIEVTRAALTAITVTPELPTVPAGVSMAFTAIGHFSDLTTQDMTAQVAWTTADSSVATIGATGLARAFRAGSTAVVASLGSVRGSTTLTVVSAALTALAVTPSPVSVPAGLEQALRVTGTFSDNSSQDLTAQVAWSTSDALVARVSSAGVVTGLKTGSATVTASLLGRSTICNVTVTGAVLQGLALSPGTATLAAGYQVQFAATGVYSDGSTHDVTAEAAWSSSSSAVAVLSSGPGAQGLVTGVAAGLADVTATLAGMTATAPVTVTAAVLTAISVSPDLPGVPAGLKQPFTAIGIFSDQTSLDLTERVAWSTSDPTVADISSTGVARALRQGTVVVTAALDAINASTTMTVTAATIQDVAITPPTATIAKGTTAGLQVTGTFSDGSVADVTAQVAWTSDSPSVSISVADGVAVATGMAVGSANVTATFGGLTDTAVITVTPATLVSIAVAPTTATIPVSLSQQLTATGTFTDATTQDLTTQVAWSSSNVQVAPVSSTGLVTGLAAGNARVTATLLGVSGGCDVTVAAVTLQAISIQPDAASVASGYKVQFRATGAYSDGSSYDVTSRVVWSSSNAAVATVSNKPGSQGLATGVSAGTATISATMSGVAGSAGLTVTNARLASVAVTPASFSVSAGTKLQLTATGTFDDGSTQDLTRQCSWTSSARRTARVSQTGLVTAAKKGNVVITASKGGRSGTATGVVN